MSRKCGGARAAGRIPAALSPQRGERAGPVGRGRAAGERRGPGRGGGRLPGGGEAREGVEGAVPRCRPAGAWPGGPHRAPLAPGRGRGRGAAEVRERGPERPCTTFGGLGQGAAPGGGRSGAELSGHEARSWGEMRAVRGGSCSPEERALFPALPAGSSPCLGRGGR